MSTGYENRGYVEPSRLTPDVISLLKPNSVVSLKLDIAEGRYRSDSADKNEPASYEAPPGMVIYDHDIEHSGHNSSTWWVKTTQAGALGFEHKVIANLTSKIRKGMMEGKLTWKGVNLFDGGGSANFSNFLKEFEALYLFRAHTNSNIHFRWSVRTKRGRYGASIKSAAYIRLMKVNTSQDAARATQVIEAALESGTTENLFDLMGEVLGSGKEPQELDMQTDFRDDPDVNQGEPVDIQLPPSSDVCGTNPTPDNSEPSDGVAG